MARTHKYLNHLLQHVGITPACSEEERAAAELVAGIYREHGFEPEIQEFNAPTFERLSSVVAGALLLVGSLLSFFGTVCAVVGLLLALLGAALAVLDKLGKTPDFLKGPLAPSQNVIAYHKAEGPLASPRNRPVVVVAHCDSPRADMLFRPNFARLRPMLLRVLPIASCVSAALVLLSLFPFPAATPVVLRVLALAAAIVPAFYAVTVVMNRFVLPYTTGSVCNKSSLAALLGVMDAVAPYQGESEFPDDIPFEEFRETHMRRPEEPDEQVYLDEDGNPVPAPEGAEAYADAAVAAGDVAVSGADAAGAEGMAAGLTNSIPLDEMEKTSEMQLSSQGTEVIDFDAAREGASAEEEPQEESSVLNAAGNYRYGADVIRELAIVPESCALVYEDDVPAEKPVVASVATGAVIDATSRFAAQAQAAVPASEREDAGLDGEDAEKGVEGAGDEAVPRSDELGADSVLADRDGDIEEEGFDALAGEPADTGDALSVEGDFISDDVGDGTSESFEGAGEQNPTPVAAVDEEQDGEYEADGDVSSSAAPVAPSPSRRREVSPLASFDPAEVDTPVGFGAGFAVAPEAVASVDDAPPASAAAGSDPAQRPLTGETVAFTVHPAAPASESASTQVFSSEQLSDARDAAVDALMQEISPSPRTPASAPSDRASGLGGMQPPAPQRSFAARSALFDLPDPSAPSDPFAVAEPAKPQATGFEPAATTVFDGAPATSGEPFELIESPSAPTAGTSVAPTGAGSEASSFDVISAPAPAKAEKPKRGLGRFFGKKKRQEESMGDWLGVGDDFDAKSSGRDIGSWDNFDDGDGWKGGAVASGDVPAEDMLDAIASMGDDELLGHDIWFVATGASACGQVGMRTFLEAHRDKLRGVFLINLESIGAGEVSVLTTEGRQRVYKGDRRIVGLLNQVSGDFHAPFSAADMPCFETDATAAMKMSLRSATVAGTLDGHLAYSHCELDVLENVSPENVETVAEVVTEVIRRS